MKRMQDKNNTVIATDNVRSVKCIKIRPKEPEIKKSNIISTQSNKRIRNVSQQNTVSAEDVDVSVNYVSSRNTSSGGTTLK
jgi:hypothetical protein